MKIGSKQINTPGNFRQDQEERYKKVEKIPGGNVYKFVSTTGKERYAVKQNGKYTTLYNDQGKKEVYKP
tara:strand:- start:631 stop:837 length:207 start_codon:yes stop_codon:yes gene_type:complete